MTHRGHGEGSIYHRNDGRWAASSRPLVSSYNKTFCADQDQAKFQPPIYHDQTHNRLILHYAHDVYWPRSTS